MKKPLISIIITYYNKKKYIRKTINSLINQTYKNYQLIFVFDDQNKEDLFFIKKILKKIKNKKIINNKKNLGVAKSRNLALNYVKGKLIAFLDADDVWNKRKLEIQTKIMFKKNVDLSYTSFDVINERGRFLNRRTVSESTSYNELVKKCEIGLSTVMVKSKIMKKNRFPLIKTQEDFGLWLKLLRKGFKFYAISKVCSSWRKNANSLSSNTSQKIKDAFTLFYKYENKNLIFSIFSVLILSINKILNRNQ